MFLKLYAMAGGLAIVVNMDTVKYFNRAANIHGGKSGSKLTFLDGTTMLVVEDHDAILSRLEVQ